MVCAVPVTACWVCVNSWPGFFLWLNASVFSLDFLVGGTCHLSGFSSRCADVMWAKRGERVPSVEGRCVGPRVSPSPDIDSPQHLEAPVGMELTECGLRLYPG